MKAIRSGFTYIEVLACLMVVTLGVAAAIGMTYYAMILGARAQGKATGYATALTAAIDPAPLMHTPALAHWTGVGPDGVGTVSGWLNGYYVVRTETGGNSPAAGFTSDPVSVDVYDGIRGNLVASYSTRVMKQGFSP